jgi:hypothetical protein
MQTITPNGFATNTTLGTTTLVLVVRSSFQSIMHSDLINTFFNQKEFAESVSYAHATGEAKAYLGIFNEPYIGTNPGGDVEVITTVPQVRIRQDAFARYPTKGDTCIIRGVTFTVTNARPDGVGVMLIYLNRRDR